MEIRGILNFLPILREVKGNQVKKVKESELSKKILSITDQENIDSIYIFGSFVNPKIEIYQPKPFLFGLIKFKERKVIEKMHDIDILVVTKMNYNVAREYKEDIQGSEYEVGYDWEGWISGHFKDFLHLIFTDRTSWNKAIQDGDPMATRISNYMVKIY